MRKCCLDIVRTRNGSWIDFIAETVIEDSCDLQPSGHSYLAHAPEICCSPSLANQGIKNRLNSITVQKADSSENERQKNEKIGYGQIRSEKLSRAPFLRISEANRQVPYAPRVILR
jgi:hypothetical protein